MRHAATDAGRERWPRRRHGGGRTGPDAARRRPRRGLPMPCSCTVGSCRECAVKLLREQVSHQTPDGRVLTCTSAPLTDVTLEV
ncbi:2Fe-2S iron-sulfur cluster-binding protein [Lentzea sp. DG1S-22]|uniref:2Fe-2S iron-sulfur cluster-binding protein n=1 Tax=Lentzea sp. DG1S-22 TaxID=3108822 RepID=UPI003FA57409